jgi:hypothetical protein
MRLATFLSLLIVLALAEALSADIEIRLPLKTLVAQSEVIAIVEVQRFDAEKQRAMLVVERVLKGDALERLPVQLRGTGDGPPDDMLVRIAAGHRLLVFLAPLGGNQSQVYAYGTGSWFLVRGVQEGSVVRCQFVQAEPYLRKTFHGPTEELVALLDAHLKDNAPLPEIDEQAESGLGPTLIERTQPGQSTAMGAIEFGPAWQTSVKTNTSKWPAIVAPVLLAAAWLCLFFALIRSQPQEAKAS